MPIGLRQSLRTRFFSHPTIIIVFALIAGALFIVLDGLVSPGFKDATSVPFAVISDARFFYHTLFLYGALVCSLVFLFRRKWLASSCYFAAACIAYASIYAALAVKGDRFAFPGGAHHEIAAIYNQRAPELDLSNPIPRLMADEQCHPSIGCGCWIAIDPEHTSGIEQDVGGWRPPTASIFPTKATPDFRVVNVRRLDAKAFSVLGCDMDMRGLLWP